MPGVTSNPSASSVSRAAPSTRPTSVTTPSVIATSAVRAGAPVPSTTVPPLITKSCICGSSSQLAEERADVVDQQVGLFERSEVTAAVEARVALEVERAFRPRARCAEDLLRENGGRGRHLHPLPHRAEAAAALGLAVETHRGVDRVRHPVDGEVREQRVAADGVLGVAVVVGPRPELLDDPTREASR